MKNLKPILTVLKKAIHEFWKFMIKPNKNNKISMWKFILLFSVLLYGYFNIKSYLDRPIYAKTGAESVTFEVDGDYFEGEDINSGTYNVLLTKLTGYGELSVSVEVIYNEESYFFEILSEENSPQRVSIPKGATIQIDGHGTNNTYKVAFLTDSGYEDYKKELILKPKKSKKAFNTSSTPKPSTSETTTETTTNTSLIDVAEFTTKYSNLELQNGSVYQFNTYPDILHLWGPVESGKYGIYLYNGGNPTEELWVYTTEEEANRIRDAKNLTVTVRVTNDVDLTLVSAQIN